MEDANIRMAMEAEKEFVKDHDCITAYEQHQKYLRDKYARESFLIKEGRKEGIKEGEARGEKRGLAKAVNALKKKGKTHGFRKSTKYLSRRLMISRIIRREGMYRVQMASVSKSPFSSAREIISRAWPSLAAKAFSHSTFLPAFRAARVHSRWWEWGVAI